MMSVCFNSHKGIFTKKSLSYFQLGLWFGPHNLASIHSNSCTNNSGSMFNNLCSNNDHTNLDNVLKLYPSSVDLFNKMCGAPNMYDETMINILIKCYCRSNNTEQGFSVLGCSFKQGIIPHVSTYNALLNGFIVEDKTHEAETLFNKFMNNQICEPNIVTYNTMIKWLCKIGKNFAAIGLLRIMNGRGVCKPNIVTYNTVIDGFCNDVMIDEAFKIFKEIVSNQTATPDVFTYNSLIYALCKLGRWDEVCRMLKQMKDERITPIVKTFNIIVNALCKQGKIKEAEVVFDAMVESGGNYPPDIMTYNSLIDGYCLRDEMTKAKTVFDSMMASVKPNVDTYNILLGGYYQDWKLHEAIHMFLCLIKNSAKPKPNMVTEFIMQLVSYRLKERQRCSTVKGESGYEEVNKDLSYWIFFQDVSDTYDLKKALYMYHFMEGTKLNSYIEVYNILIDVANKCGKFNIAKRLFHDIYVKAGMQPCLKTYAVMISGLCRGGRIKDAKHMYHEMTDKSGYLELNEMAVEIINDLIQGYVKYKPSNHVYLFVEELAKRGLDITLPNALPLTIMDYYEKGSLTFMIPQKRKKRFRRNKKNGVSRSVCQ